MTMGMGDFEPPDEPYADLSDEEYEEMCEARETAESDSADDVLAALKDEGMAPWQR